MHVMGLDPGSQRAGYSCLKALRGRPIMPAHFELVDAGCLKIPAKLDFTDKITILHEQCYSLFQRFSPQAVVVEKAFFGNSASSALKLGEARGAIIAAAGRCGLRIEQITPTEVKKTLTGNGHSTKDQVATFASRLLKVDGHPELKGQTLAHDATDAMAIALAYALQGGFVARPLDS